MGISTGVALARLLEAWGVDTVFGIPGVHTVELYRGLAASGIRHVTPRHEQGAGFMADGYARATGRPGVCLVITGPGVTNVATAMGQAWGDSVPMLVISSVNAHGAMGSGAGWLHELPDQRALAAGVAAFSRTVHVSEALPQALAEAFAVFEGGRPRPVHIELPLDVMHAPMSDAPVAGAPVRMARPAPAPEAVEAAAAWLDAAERPVILAGGGVVRAAEAVQALAEALDAPVAMTTNGRGILPPDHPLNVSLSASMPATRAMVAESDVVLALGTELGSTDYDAWEDGGFAIPGRFIRADIDPAQALRGSTPDLVLLGDAGLAARLLAGRIAPRHGTGAMRAAAARAGIAALPAAMRGDLALLDLVREALPDAPVVGDSTQISYAGNVAFAPARAGGYWSSATGFGTLGYALPAAIGAAVGTGGPVVGIVGDGGLQFGLGELASAVEAGARVILLVHDNAGYGEIKGYMEARNVPPLGVDILTPNLGAIAAACGWHVDQPTAPVELPGMLAVAAQREGPTMILFGEALRAAFSDEPRCHK